MQRIISRSFGRVARLGMMAFVLAASSIISTPAAAQVPQPLPTPNVNLLTSGSVYAIARMADGSVVIGGQFVSVNGALRSNIAKRLPDGTLDPDWHPAIDGYVAALAVDSDGNVYAGGEFSHVDGYARRNLVKISPKGKVVPGWDPSPDGVVFAMASHDTDELFVGGDFGTIGGITKTNLAKLSQASGTVDIQWSPEPSGQYAVIFALANSQDGMLIVGGYFPSIGASSHRNLAKVAYMGSGAADPDWDPSPNRAVFDIAVAPDGSVFVAGDFWQFRSATGDPWLQSNVAKLSGTGSGLIVGSWDPFNFAPPGPRQHIAVDANGWVYVSGQGPLLDDGTTSNVFRVSQMGAGPIDTSWNPQVIGSPYVLSFADGKLLVGGQLSTASRQTRLGFVSLKADASPDVAFDAEAPGGATFAVAAQSDGRLIISGQFAKANGQLRGGLLRLNADGSLDMNWNPSPVGFVRAIIFATDGSAIVGGNFSQIGGQSMDAVAKLSSTDGAADPNWKPDLGGYVRALATDNAGLIYAGGYFNHGSGAATQRNLVRVSDSGTGAVDTTWLPDPDSGVEELSLDGQGALFARGQFLTMNGASRKRIAKLLTTGPTVLDVLWNPLPAAQMYEIVADGFGSVFVAGGGFPIAGGGSTGSIAKLSASGAGAADPLWKPFSGRVARHIAIDAQSNSLFADSSTYDATTGIDTYYLTKHSTNGTGDADPSWNPTVNSAVADIQISSGKVLLGGYFTQVSGQPRYGLAALPINAPDEIYASGFEATP